MKAVVLFSNLASVPSCCFAPYTLRQEKEGSTASGRKEGRKEASKQARRLRGDYTDKWENGWTDEFAICVSSPLFQSASNETKIIYAMFCSY